MSDSLTVETLAALIMKTGQSHKQAYISANAIDPDWAIWYSGFLQAQLFDLVENVPPRSELVHMLVQANIDYPVDTNPDWLLSYAKDMLPRITG